MTEKVTILNHIGNTPLLKLSHVTDSLGVDIFVKCEFTNPGGSIKDRMALCMIEEAEKRGDLKPGGTIVDQSSGTTQGEKSWNRWVVKLMAGWLPWGQQAPSSAWPKP